jgi:prevent-host-death family protein
MWRFRGSPRRTTGRVGRRRRVEQIEQIPFAEPVALAVYNAYDARTMFAHLLDRVREGEQIVIARRGVATAKLVPVEGDERLRPGVFRTHVVVHDLPRRSR